MCTAVLWCGWSVGSFMVVDHEHFDINACLNAQGEFLDVTGGAGGAAGTSRFQRLGGVVRQEWRCCGAAGASSVSAFRHLGGVSVSVSVLLERRQLAVGGLRRGRPQVALSLWIAFVLEEAFLRERRGCGAAGAFGFSGLWCTAISSSTRAFSPWGSFSTRTTARRCCWNVEALAFVESFDVNGGAMVLQERRRASCQWATTTWPQPGLQLSDRVLPTRTAALGLLLERRGQLLGGVVRRARQRGNFQQGVTLDPRNRRNLWRRKGRKLCLLRTTTFSATSSAFGGADV